MNKTEYIKGIISFLESNHPQSSYLDLLELVCDAAERNHLGFEEDSIDLLEQAKHWINSEIKRIKAED